MVVIMNRISMSPKRLPDSALGGERQEAHEERKDDKLMETMTTHLWFDKEAKEAAEFYVSTFPDSKITSTGTLNDTPSGSVEMVSFELLGRRFQTISAGPYFKFNPSVSFHVTCSTKDDVDRIWARLSDGGGVLMELGSYPFSERYG